MIGWVFQHGTPALQVLSRLRLLRLRPVAPSPPTRVPSARLPSLPPVAPHPTASGFSPSRPRFLALPPSAPRLARSSMNLPARRIG